MKPKNILVIRLSAIGDVAMTIPVLQQVLQQNPDVQFTVLTQPLMAPLFEPLERTTVVPVYTKDKHKSVLSLFRLCRQVNRHKKIDAVADLHDVLRSALMRLFFTSRRIPVAIIDKGRKEKRQLTSRTNKKLQRLKTTFQRYADVFIQLGLKADLNTGQPVYPKKYLPGRLQHIFPAGKKKILIAPFAGFAEKMYPTEKMKTVLQKLLAYPELQLFLLGAGKKETELLQQWETEMPGLINLAGQYSFADELAIISHMDLVISMDSAPMHLASLFDVPVVSVWGATHPYAGFYGWKQDESLAVQISLECRPCSVFGNKKCYRGDHACMRQLPEEFILEKVKSIAGIPAP
jgi:ADP-heptose:LPS heptosyltransferase